MVETHIDNRTTACSTSLMSYSSSNYFERASSIALLSLSLTILSVAACPKPDSTLISSAATHLCARVWIMLQCHSSVMTKLCGHGTATRSATERRVVVVVFAVFVVVVVSQEERPVSSYLSTANECSQTIIGTETLWRHRRRRNVCTIVRLIRIGWVWCSFVVSTCSRWYRSSIALQLCAKSFVLSFGLRFCRARRFIDVPCTSRPIQLRTVYTMLANRLWTNRIGDTMEYTRMGSNTVDNVFASG